MDRAVRGGRRGSALPGLSRAIYRQTIAPASWEPFPDTLPVLTALAEKSIPIGVVSDTGFDFRPVFEAVRIAPLLTAIVLSFECGACKPAPGVFELACRLLGTPPAETLMVGDSWLTDAGAVAAGLTVLLLPAAGAAGPRGLARVPALLTEDSESQMPSVRAARRPRAQQRVRSGASDGAGPLKPPCSSV